MQEISVILTIRAKTEGIPVSEESVKRLSEIGGKTSLRYAIQLLTPAYVLTKINGREEINVDDVDEVDELFYDSKSSAAILMKSKDKFIS
jgi:RuvB-like protein 1